MEGTVLIKRICGHSSPYTFKKNERYGKQRLEKFLSKKCPACTVAAIQQLEGQQKAEKARRKAARRDRPKAADGDAEPQPASC
ncbi:MAG TPA: hypothetical protein VHZ24_17510 [Pirellulales bacterium]|nr:hypothetical protein [Pirellulales bacterium]